jgi:F-type H+-transporting ATPase subunit b
VSAGFATVALVLAPPEHEGGHEEAHGFLGIPNVVWQTLNLSLFLVLLFVLLKKPAAAFFGNRRKEVDEANRKAEADRQRAEELAKEIDARLSGIAADIASLRAHAATESDSEKTQLVAEAEADAARIVARGSAEIDARVREARRELTAFAGDLAVEMAEEIVKKSATADDHARLVSEGTDALSKLAAVPSGRKG